MAINKEIFKAKYKSLINTNKESFIKELERVKPALTKYFNTEGSGKEPIMTYIRSGRNAFIYLYSMLASVKADKICDYEIVTGQAYIDQHFMNAGKDLVLNDSLRHSDITFISLSQFDYNNQYLENLLIELIEYRTNLGKPTVIIYEVLDLSSYEVQTARISQYLTKLNSFVVLDLVKTAQHGTVLNNPTISKPVKVVGTRERIR